MYFPPDFDRDIPAVVVAAKSNFSLGRSTVTQQRVGVKHFITLRSEIPELNRRTYSEQRNQPTTFRATKKEMPNECNSKELLSMTWKLNLLYERGGHVFDDTRKSEDSIIKLTPQIEMVPDPGMKEKLGDVWIALRKSLYINGSSVPIRIAVKSKCSQGVLMSVPCEDTIVLRKQELYKCDLTFEDSPIAVFDGNNYSCVVKSIAFEVDIYPIKHTFNIIDPIAISPCPMLQDFRSMLAFNEETSKQKFCDVIITCPATNEDDDDPNSEELSDSEDSEEEEEERKQRQKPKGKEVFYAHKAILAARCTVFAKMFSADMKESATNTVNLVDIKPDALKELLTYIYSGECPNIETHAESLLYQAEIYDLSRLKALCEERLSYDLQVDNAVRILLLADTCNAKQLKWNSLLFIHEFCVDVRKTEEWEEVKKSRELLEDLFNVKCDHEPAAKRPKLL